MRAILTVGLLSCVLAVLGCAQTTQASGLVFVKDGNVHLYTSGGSIQQLTTGFVARQPRLSNGIIIFHANNRLYKTQATPYAPVVEIPNTANALDFDLNPTADRIVLTYTNHSYFNTANFTIWLMNIDGSGKTALESADWTHYADPRWGRDGWIYLLLSPFGDAYAQRIYRMRPTPGNTSRQQLVQEFSQRGVEGGVSGRVAMLKSISGATTAIHTMRPDGTNQQTVPNTPTFVWGIDSGLAFDYAEDAIYYGWGGGIYRIRIGDAQPQLITAPADLNAGLDCGYLSSSNQQPRTFLITFTGFGNRPEGSLSFGGDPGANLQMTSGRAMVTLLKNVKNIMPGKVISQGFAYFDEQEHKNFATDMNWGHYLPPSDPHRTHPAALNWLKGYNPKLGDRLVIAGHSYGGNRARLFAEEVARQTDLPKGLTSDLFLIDPVDYESCSVSKLAGSAALLGLLHPNPIQAWPLTTAIEWERCRMHDRTYDVSTNAVKPGRLFLFRETKGYRPFYPLNTVTGYRVTHGSQQLPSANEVILPFGHELIEDLDVVQAAILQALSPQAPSYLEVGLYWNIQGVSLGQFKPPDQALQYRVEATFNVGNRGPLIADAVKLTDVRLNDSIITCRDPEGVALTPDIPAVIEPGSSYSQRFSFTFTRTVLCGDPVKMRIEATLESNRKDQSRVSGSLRLR